MTTSEFQLLYVFVLACGNPTSKEIPAGHSRKRSRRSDEDPKELLTTLRKREAYHMWGLNKLKHGWMRRTKRRRIFLLTIAYDVYCSAVQYIEQLHPTPLTKSKCQPVITASNQYFIRNRSLNTINTGPARQDSSERFVATRSTTAHDTLLPVFYAAYPILAVHKPKNRHTYKPRQLQHRCRPLCLC